MVTDLICIALLFHFHVLGKLVFKTLFETEKWTKKLLSGFAGLILGMVFVEFFLFCGMPESPWELLSFRCREPTNILVEYAVLFILAASDFLHSSNYFDAPNPSDK